MTIPGPRLLLVEDDESARRLLEIYLARTGYRVDEAGTGADAMRAWDAHRADLILLDLGLPDADGVELVRRIRREATTPIVVLSARGAERDKIAALEAGADDYLTKPFGTEELNARIRAVLRRAAGPQGDPQGRLVIGPIELDILHHSVTVGGVPVRLTPREFELLKVLLTYPGRVVTKGRLLRAVWGLAYAEESHYVHVYVNRLRRKLAAADPTGSVEDLIATEPGVGYRIADEPVRTSVDAPPSRVARGRRG
jgi:two-component system, OmpR family, KDP operon response regulator KdpE